MKVAELEGAQLDYWAAQHSPQCINLHFEWRSEHWVGIGEIDGKDEVIVAGAAPGFFAAKKVRMLYGKELMAVYRPSSDWSQGGPLLEQENIGLMPAVDRGREYWLAAHQNVPRGVEGDTPLVAAMRAYVASKFGAEVPDAGSIPVPESN